MTAPLGEGHRLAVRQLQDLEQVGERSMTVVVEPTAATLAGFAVVQISLDCYATPTATGGISLRQRERFLLWVPSDFPFRPPIVRTPHRRWADVPHVQWGSTICLYAAPSVEWVPADGMRGLVWRLRLWLAMAALGELDPAGEPLHPPVAYPTSENGFIVVRADVGGLAPPPAAGSRRSVPSRPTGSGGDAPTEATLVVGVCESRHAGRLDLVEWIEYHEWLRRCAADEVGRGPNGGPLTGVLGVLADREMTFEYPARTDELLRGLEGIGVVRQRIIKAIGGVTAANAILAQSQGLTVDEAETVRFTRVFVGTPSRRGDDGVLRTHLVCWVVDEIGRLITEGLFFAHSGNEYRAKIGQLAQEHLHLWIDGGVSWVGIMEDRGEVTVRRDFASPERWLKGRRVAVLGCGALGAPIAEMCVRAGAAEVGLIDNDVVTPGVLVRQNFYDHDIGVNKAVALADRLNKISASTIVVANAATAERALLHAHAPPPDFDLVIDATADNALSGLLELRRAASRDTWPPVVSVMIGHDAKRGLVTVAKPGATGAQRHILRSVALAARTEPNLGLADVADDFFPCDPRRPTFQPEPGCSSPTFTGSAAELAALAGHLFHAGVVALAGGGPAEADEPMVAAVVRLGDAGGVRWLGWQNDCLSVDTENGYEVRFSQPALSRMAAEVRRGARLRGPKVETGGLLLGQVDDACRCVWVDDVSGPPPDSWLSEVHFEHGVEGVEDTVGYHRGRSGRLSTFVGMWHSHPYGQAAPSPTDRRAMHVLVAPVADGPRRALVLIVGGVGGEWDDWLSGEGAPAVFARFVERSSGGLAPEAAPVPPSHQRDGFSGGWAVPARKANHTRRRFSLRRLRHSRR